MKQLIFLLVLAALLVACAETKVVQIDSNQPAETTDTQAPETTDTQAPALTGTAVDTAGKTITACDDMDVDDPNQLGVVEVTYSDGTSEKFYDYCPGVDIGNDRIITEYICDEGVVKSKNYVCSKSTTCMVFNVKADPGKKVGACV